MSKGRGTRGSLTLLLLDCAGAGFVLSASLGSGSEDGVGQAPTGRKRHGKGPLGGNRAGGWGEQPHLSHTSDSFSFPGHTAGGSLPRMSPPSPAVCVPDMASVYGAMFPPWPSWRPLQTCSCLDTPCLAEGGEHCLPQPQLPWSC